MAATEGATDASKTMPTPKPEDKPAPPPPRKVMKSVMADKLDWKPLVPEAGDKGPMVATMFGDMMSAANGFFIKLPAGDKGLLHTHTNDYHGVGVTATSAAQDGGKTHAVAASSYWFQPGGTAHLNACPGKTPCIGFAHFTAGKFDFAPAKPAKGAKPDPKAVEKTAKAAKWVKFDETNAKSPAFSPLWGDMKTGPFGMYIKTPPGNAAFWHLHSSDYHAVVLAGTVDHRESGTEPIWHTPGSYWWQPAGNKHVDLCKADGPECLIYLYMEGPFDVVQPADDGKL